jgi:hypothetical protein
MNRLRDKVAVITGGTSERSGVRRACHCGYYVDTYINPQFEASPTSSLRDKEPRFRPGVSTEAHPNKRIMASP